MQEPTPISAVTVHPAISPAGGAIVPPPDKSITHRALFLGALNHGRTRIVAPSSAADCRSSLELLRALGYVIESDGDDLVIDGAARREHPEELVLDCGNSGTTARFALGFLTGERGRFTLVGDASLMRRPMERVAEPLRRLGARVETSDGRLPATVTAMREAPGSPGHGVLNVGSAQVHTALVLAALRSRTGAALSHVAKMRDHTARMLRYLAPRAIHTDLCRDNDRPAVDAIRPIPIDRDATIVVPGDVSAAAFFVVAALLVPGSHLVIERVGLNPTRIAFLESVRAMGARISWALDLFDPEPVGSITIRYTEHLRGIDLSAGDENDHGISVAEMMDELPLVALIASRAEGRTIVGGAAELRVKESDRISATAALLRSLGIEIEEREDGFAVAGPQPVAGGGSIDHHGDHRLCMLAAVAALAAGAPVTIPEPAAAAVSYPMFWRDLARLTCVEEHA